MPAPRPPLLTLLRSENQLRLLAALLLEPNRAFTVRELVEQTDVPQPSVSREMAKLAQAGIVVAGSDRHRLVYQANAESPIYPELSSLMLKTMGPVPVLERLLSGVPRVEWAGIYGSWARRYAGVRGADPRDIDVIVVGHPDVARVRGVAQRATDELGRDVNITVLTPPEWEARQSGFLREVGSRGPIRVLELAPAQAAG